MITDYYFWFANPPTQLNKLDWIFGYLFITLFAVGIIVLIVRRFVAHTTVKKLYSKFVHKDLTLGISGLVWLGMRYENIPIFAKRFWAGALLVILFIWIIWILKYLIFDFAKDKGEYDQNQLKSKYLPQKK